MIQGPLVTAYRLGLKEYARSYVLVGLLVYLPAAYVTLVGYVTPSVPIPVRVPVDGLTVELLRDLPVVNAVVMAPATCAFIAGIAGLFLMRRSRDADDRLVLAGYPRWQVIGARIGLLATICGLVSGVAVGVLLINYPPELLPAYAGATLLAALTYGLVGVLVGTYLGRLSGMYVVLFAPMLDVGVFQNPMFMRADPALWMQLLPGHFPMTLAIDAAFTAEIDATLLLQSGVVLVGLGSLAVTAFYRATRID